MGKTLENVVVRLAKVEMSSCTQNGWITPKNRKHFLSGSHFASMPDFYAYFKQIAGGLAGGSKQDQESAERLRQELFEIVKEGEPLITSTRFRYWQHTDECDIYHRFQKARNGSEEDAAYSIVKVKVPAYDGNQALLGTIKDEVGIKYVQTVFCTSDDISIINIVLGTIFPDIPVVVSMMKCFLDGVPKIPNSFDAAGGFFLAPSDYTLHIATNLCLKGDKGPAFAAMYKQP